MFFSMFLSVFALFGIGLRRQSKGQDPLYSVHKDFFLRFYCAYKKKAVPLRKNWAVLMK